MADMILMGVFLLVFAVAGWHMGPKMWEAIPKKEKPVTKWPRKRN